MARLQDKVAIVTGSSSGIGESIARSLAAEGAHVVVNSSSSVDAGQAVARALPHDAIYVRADVASQESCAALIDAAVEKWGRLDILVNNAGTTKVIPHDDLDAVTDEVFQHILDVNVLGTWRMIRTAAPHLRAAAADGDGPGSIVNITSLAGVRPGGSSVPYAVSKAGLNHMTRLLAKSLGPDIRVNAVAPGLIATPWTADWDAAHAGVAKTAPLRRSGEPGEIADATIGLLLSAYATGQVLTVDGGLGLT
jgi:ketoreductase RED2